MRKRPRGRAQRHQNARPWLRIATRWIPGAWEACRPLIRMSMNTNRIVAALLITALVAGPFLALTGSEVAHGDEAPASEERELITGTCTVSAPPSGTQVVIGQTITMPDGKTLPAFCYERDWLQKPDHNRYVWPAAGTYPFTATKNDNGTYFVLVHSQDAPPFNGVNVPGYPRQQVYTPEWPVDVRVNFSKTSADASFTQGNQEYAYAGAVYDIFEESTGNKAATITTDETGRANCTLKANTRYYAVETKAPAGFTLNPERVPFTTGKDTMDVTLADTPGRVTLRIVKRDSSTGGAAQAGASLAGAEYKAVDARGIAHTGTTDEAGTLTFDNLPLGRIVVTETKAPTGYKLDTTPHEYYVRADELNVGGVVTLEPEQDFSEHVIAFDLEIAKFKNDPNDEGSGVRWPAKGVQFEIVSNTTDRVLTTLTTDEYGFAQTPAGAWYGNGTRPSGVSGSLPYDKKGYTVREIASTVPDGYERMDDFTIEPNQMADGVRLKYIIENATAGTRLQIVKKDASSNQTVPLPGFTFRLLDNDKNPITQEAWYPNHVELTEFTTDDSGCVTLPEKLVPGTYYIEERAVQPPYLLNGTLQKVEIDGKHGPVAVVSFSNTQATGQAHLVKMCTGDGSALADAEFDVVAQEQITSPDGSIQAVAGEVVDHVVTDTNGKATTRKLPLGTGTAPYAFVETKAPDGHALDTTPHPFALSYADQDTEVVATEVTVSDAPTKLHVNKRVTGRDEALEGAAFAVWNQEDEIPLAQDDEITHAFALRMDSDDHEVSLTLPGDDAHVPLAWQEDNQAYVATGITGPTTVTVDGKDVGDVRIENKTYAQLQKGAVEKLPILLRGSKKPTSHTTDATGAFEVDHLDAGTWKLVETNAPDGYVPDGTVHSFTVTAGGLIEGTATHSLTVYNDYTKVDISKRDISNEAELPGAHLILTDSEGTTRDEWVSDGTPHRIEMLKPGTYTLTERMTPHAHDPAHAITFTVYETGEVQQVVMYDEPIEIEGGIDKRQEIADPVAAMTEANGDGGNRADVSVSDDGTFSYSIDMRSTSSTWTDEFTVTDEIAGAEAGLAVLDHVDTPQGSQDYDGLLNVWYRTNLTPADYSDPSGANATLNDGHDNPWLHDASTQTTLGDDGRAVSYTGWKLWQEGISTAERTRLNVSDLHLKEGETIVAVRFEYGRVEAGFTTRPGVWDREDLKDEHDDVDDIAATHAGRTFMDQNTRSVTRSDGSVIEMTQRELDLHADGAGYLIDPDGDGVPEFIPFEQVAAPAGNSHAFAPAILTLHVTDAYHAGTTLENGARVDLYRNGGGDHLEDHDADGVVQTPKTLLIPLDQTGVSGILALLAAFTTVGAVLLMWRPRHTSRNKNGLKRLPITRLSLKRHMGAAELRLRGGNHGRLLTMQRPSRRRTS